MKQYTVVVHTDSNYSTTKKYYIMKLNTNAANLYVYG